MGFFPCCFSLFIRLAHLLGISFSRLLRLLNIRSLSHDSRVLILQLYITESSLAGSVLLKDDLCIALRTIKRSVVRIFLVCFQRTICIVLLLQQSQHQPGARHSITRFAHTNCRLQVLVAAGWGSLVQGVGGMNGRDS